MNKQQIQDRIKEIEAAIMQQGQYVQQMNNQILMFHGAKEELSMHLNKLIEAEKIAADEEAKKQEQDNDAVQDDCVALDDSARE